MFSHQVRFYDGKYAKSYQCLVTLTSHGLCIEYEQEKVYWHFQDIFIVEKPDFKRPVILSNTKNKEARLVINDPSILSTISPKLHRHNLPRISVTISFRSLLLWGIAAIAVLAGIIKFAPYLAERIATNIIPYSFEKYISTQAEQSITTNSKYCNSTAGSAALSKIQARFASVLDPNVRFQITVVDNSETNALALPDGKILILSGLLHVTQSPEELASVIAHELGHIVKHHPTQNFIRLVGFDVLVRIVFGHNAQDINAVSLANSLLQSKYSRDMEVQADEIALELLTKSNINSEALITFFKRINDNHADRSSDFLKYLSSHPKTQDRIKRTREIHQKPVKVVPILLDQEWHALKSICKQ